MTEGPISPSRFLQQTLLFNFIIHGLAMASMALFLLPGMPGGKMVDLAVRAAYVAEHPWLWRLGWLPWQITAFTDLLLGFALVRTRWIPRLPAWLTLLCTIGAVLPDQSGQFLWVTHGVYLAQEALRSGNLADYRAFEATAYMLVAAWGCLGYVLGAIGWTWCFAAAGTWSRMLTWLSVVVWSVFILATIIVFLPPAWQPNPLVVAGGNAAGFVLLQIWFVLVILRVRARDRAG